MCAEVELDPLAVLFGAVDRTVVAREMFVQVYPPSSPKITPSCPVHKPRFVPSIPPTTPPEDVLLVASSRRGVMLVFVG